MVRICLRVALLLIAACGSASELGYDDPPGDTFCARLSPRPFFCDDFDTGTLKRWTQSDVSNGALAPTRVDFTSSPYALEVSIAAGGANAQTVKSFAGLTGFTRMKIAFEMRADPKCFTESTQVKGVTVMSLQASPMHGFDAPGFFVQLNVAGTVTSLVYGLPIRPTAATQAPRTLFVGTIPNGVWSQVDVDIDLVTQVLTAVTGGVTTTTSLAAWPAGSGALDSPLVTLGVAGGVTPCTALFDDFIFDAH